MPLRRRRNRVSEGAAKGYVASKALKNTVYPAIFYKDEDGGYVVKFPDLQGCLAYGKNMDEAKSEAAYNLYEWLTAFSDSAAPSNPSVVNVSGDDVLIMIEARARR